MKSILMLGCILLLAPVANAQKDAADMLSKVRENIANMGAFSAEFSFEIDMPESENELMEGTLYLNKDKYRIQTVEQEIISDNINIWHWSKQVDEVQVNYVEDGEDIITPNSFFSSYLRGFAYKIMAESKHKGVNVALIELIPGDRKKDYFKVKVVVDTDNDLLQQMQIFFRDGVVYTFNVSGYQKATVQDGFFTFDAAANPDVEIIDLR